MLQGLLFSLTHIAWVLRCVSNLIPHQSHILLCNFIFDHCSTGKNQGKIYGNWPGLTMPLFFTSDALYPISVMPIWLQVISYGNPLSYGVNALRSFLLTGNLNGIWLDFIVLIATLLVLSFIAGKMLKGVME
jgi:hypothetical protein